MINRIVTMTFQADKVADFMAIFDASKEKIRAFPGCHGLKLLQTTDKPYQLSTYSIWEDDDCLNAYRNSALFVDTWAKTKALFAEKPVAFSTVIVRDLDQVQ
jgi:quinol monooxygenase YgiN